MIDVESIGEEGGEAKKDSSSKLLALNESIKGREGFKKS